MNTAGFVIHGHVKTKFEPSQKPHQRSPREAQSQRSSLLEKGRTQCSSSRYVNKRAQISLPDLPTEAQTRA